MIIYCERYRAMRCLDCLLCYTVLALTCNRVQFSKIGKFCVQEFYSHVEKERAKDFEVLARKYQAIGPLLTKVEGIVVNTNTGSSPQLRQYYAYWEQKIYQSLTTVGI